VSNQLLVLVILGVLVQCTRCEAFGWMGSALNRPVVEEDFVGHDGGGVGSGKRQIDTATYMGIQVVINDFPQNGR